MKTIDYKIINNWHLDIEIENKMTGKKRIEKWQRIESLSGITPLYISPDNHFYTVGKLGLFCFDNYL